MSDLKSEKVKVAGKTITVFQASFVMSLQRSVAITNAAKETPKFYEKLDDRVVTYIHRLVYPSLVSCSEGNLPDEETFLKLSEADVNRWIAAAGRLNPDWLSSGASSEEDQKKQ